MILALSDRNNLPQFQSYCVSLYLRYGTLEKKIETDGHKAKISFWSINFIFIFFQYKN